MVGENWRFWYQQARGRGVINPKRDLGILCPNCSVLLKLATNQDPGTRKLQICGLSAKLPFEC
jgi:hypothetical protein